MLRKIMILILIAIVCMAGAVNAFGIPEYVVGSTEIKQ